MNQTLLLLAVLVPVLGSFALPFFARCPRVRNFVAFALVAAAFGCSLALVPMVLESPSPITVALNLPIGVNFILNADALAVFVALVSSLISAIVIIYSTTYVSHYKYQNEYYLMVVLFLGAMMGLVYAGNLILLYLFWEITAVASWRLIGFFREKTHLIKADKAFLITMFGSVAMLIGFIAIGTQAGTFDMIAMKQKLGGLPIPSFAAMMILAGILSKSATLPFHTWLPDAGVAPSPVTALLHAAVLVKIGVYAFARLFLVTFNVLPDFQTTVLVVAGLSALVSAGAALIETDLKRIIAYSTISQIAFIFLGLASGTKVGIAGALLYIMMHGFAKGGLFLCAGIVEQNMKTKDIRQMGGLIRTMPVTAVSFLLCSFSVMGIPPFGGFFSKYMVISGAVKGADLWLTCVFVGVAFMTILYLLRVFNMIFMGEARGSLVPEKSRGMVACVATLAIFGLLGGLFIQPLARFAEIAVQHMGLIK